MIANKYIVNLLDKCNKTSTWKEFNCNWLECYEAVGRAIGWNVMRLLTQQLVGMLWGCLQNNWLECYEAVGRAIGWNVMRLLAEQLVGMLWGCWQSNSSILLYLYCVSGSFAKLRKATVSFVMSLCLSTYNTAASTGGIFMKFYIWVILKISFLENSRFIKIWQE
jgi:hypothetical protein